MTTWSVVLNGNTWTNAQFDGQAYAVNWGDFFADVSAHVAQLVTATSTTSLAVGTGSKSLTVTPGKAFAVGQPLVIARTSAPTTTYMDGRVTAYDPLTGALTVTVVGINGSGTFTDWTITIGGARITGSIPSPVTEGGTGATTISNARVNLAIGENHGNGTVALPAMSFAADQNTGIYRISEDVLGISTGGTLRMVYGSTGNIGIGTQTPAGRVHVYAAASGQGTPNSSADELVLENNAAAGLSILTPSTASGNIYFGDETSATVGGIIYTHSNDTMALRAGGAAVVTLVSGGQIQANVSGSVSAPTYSFTSDTDSGIYRAGANSIGIALGGAAALIIDKTDIDAASPLFIGRTGTSGNAAPVAAPMIGLVTAADAAAVRTSLGVTAVGNSLFTAADAAAARTAIAMYSSIGTFTAPQRGALSSVAYAASLTLDLATSNNFDIGALTGNLTLVNPTNQVAGQSGIIFITQDGTGGRTITYGSNWLFEGGVEPALSTGANAKDTLFYFVHSSGNIYCTLLRNFA